MEALTRDLWVLIETTDEGKARNVGLELLNPGRRLADAQGGALVAVVIGSNTEDAVKEAAAYGADRILVNMADPVRIHRRTGSSYFAAQQIRQLLDQLKALWPTDSPSS